MIDFTSVKYTVIPWLEADSNTDWLAAVTAHDTDESGPHPLFYYYIDSNGSLQEETYDYCEELKDSYDTISAVVEQNIANAIKGA